MNCTTQTEGTKATVKLDGRFTFDSHSDFKAATQAVLDTPGITQLHLDFSGVSYMDSSSLGMLLLLREKSEAKGVKVSLVKPSPSVMSILKVVQFGKLFEILD